MQASSASTSNRASPGAVLHHDRKHLELLDADMKWVVEPGDFVLMAGASSEDIRLNGTLTVEDYQTRAKAIEAQNQQSV